MKSKNGDLEMNLAENSENENGFEFENESEDEWFERNTKEAEEGDERAQFLLWRYILREGVIRLEESVEQNYIPALYDYALLLENGIMYDKNIDEARQIFYDLSMKDHLDSLWKFLDTVICGDKEMMEKFEKDLFEAKAYENLCQVVMWRFRNIKYEPFSTSLDEIKMLEIAADEGCDSARITLCGIYLKKDPKEGTGLEGGYHDLEKYAKHLKKGIEENIEMCKSMAFDDYNRNRDYLKLSPDEGLQLMYDCIEVEDSYMMNLYGIMLCKGKWVEKNLQKAEEMFLKAATGGEARAYYNLAMMNLTLDNLVTCYIDACKVLEVPSNSNILGSVKLLKNNFLDLFEEDDKLWNLLADEDLKAE